MSTLNNRMSILRSGGKNFLKETGALTFFLLHNVTIKSLLLLWVFSCVMLSNSALTSGELAFLPSTPVPTLLGYLGLFALYIWLYSIYLFTKGRFTFEVSQPLVWISIYICTAVISIIINHSQYSSPSDFLKFILFLTPALLGIIMTQFFTNRDIFRVGKLIVFFAVVSSLFSFILLAYYWPDILLYDTSGLFGDRNFFSRYLVIASSFLIINNLKRIRRKENINLLSVLLCLFFLIIIMSQFSRSGYALYIISIGIIVWFYPNKHVKRIFFISLPIFAVLFAALTYTRVTQTGMNVKNASDLGRISVMKAGVNMFTANPIFGVGYGNSGKLFTEYMDKKQIGTLGVHSIHNMYLYVLAETGLLGLAAFLLLNFGILYKLYRKTKQDLFSDESNALFCFTALTMFILQGALFPSVDYDGFYWVVIAICIIELSKTSERQPKLQG